MRKETTLKKNYIYNSIYQIVSIFTPLLTTPYLSRTIGADGLGQYSFVYSVAYYFMLFIKLGVHYYGNRTIAAVRDNEHKLSLEFWSIYLFQLSMGIIYTIIYAFYSVVLARNLVFSLLMIFYVISAGIDITWFFQGLEEFRIIVTRDMFIKILSVVCTVAMVKNTEDIWIYILIRSCEFFIGQICVWPLINRYVCWIKPTIYDIRKHIVPNLVFFIPAIAVSLFKTMDKIMLGLMSNATELGYYHNSENIVQVPMVFITSLGTVMMPRITNMLSNGKEESIVNNIFKKSIITVMLISTLTCFGIMSVAKQFVPIFYGDGFDKCIKLYYILLPSCIFLAFANVIRTQYLIPYHKEKIYIIALFFAAIVNLISNWLLIPKYQSIGAAIGTLLAECCVCTVQAIMVWKKLNMLHSIADTFLFVIIGGLMFTIFCNMEMSRFSSLQGLFVKILICGLFYSIALGSICIMFFVGYRNGDKNKKIKEWEKL